jgi:hypothetical protein
MSVFSSIFGLQPAWMLADPLSILKRVAAFALTVTLAFGLLAGRAHADVWGYVDDKGVAHFASEKVDARYELFFRGATVTSGGNPAAAAPAPGPQDQKLVAFFEVSTNYKAVRHLLKEAAQTNNVDYELLKAVIVTESGFDPRAVSPRGAVGLMQMMPPTAERYGVRGEPNAPIEKKLTDPAINIRAGARYLRDLARLFPGRLDLVLASYNAGEGAVQRAGNRIPNYPETQNYVKTVMSIYSALKPPALLADRIRQTGRARVEFAPVGGAGGLGGTAGAGGALGRGNMVPSAGLPALAPVAMSPTDMKIERD